MYYQISGERRKRIVLLTATLCICSAVLSSPTIAQEMDCSVTKLAENTKVMSAFRNMDFIAHTVAHQQAEAIMEVESGIVLNIDNGAFFGPVMVIRKFSEKSQMRIRELRNANRRLGLDGQDASDLERLTADAEKLVNAGFEIADLLESGKVRDAVQVYAEDTAPTLKDAYATAYTTTSMKEREIARIAMLCR